MRSCAQNPGFTLIELSIVLVIIGLLVGGVLVGQDLFHTARLRKTVSQYQDFVTATRTFKLKYNSYPGDISCTHASAFGFPARVVCGNENERFETANVNVLPYDQSGEAVLFWVDLSAARLIPFSFTASNGTSIGPGGPNWSAYLPRSALDSSVWWFVFGNGSNVLGLSYLSYCNTANPCNIDMDGYDYNGVFTGFRISSLEAYTIDSKIDDGMPLTGRVTARNGAGNSMNSFDTLTIPASINRCVSIANNNGYFLNPNLTGQANSYLYSCSLAFSLF